MEIIKDGIYYLKSDKSHRVMVDRINPDFYRDTETMIEYHRISDNSGKDKFGSESIGIDSFRQKFTTIQILRSEKINKLGI